MSNVLKNELNVTYEKRTKNIEGETVNAFINVTFVLALKKMPKALR